MVLQRWAPISGFRRTDDIVNRCWKGFGVGPTLRNGGGWSRIPLDVVEEGDDVVVRASLPGAAPEEHPCGHRGRRSDRLDRDDFGEREKGKARPALPQQVGLVPPLASAA